MNLLLCKPGELNSVVVGDHPDDTARIAKAIVARNTRITEELESRLRKVLG